MYSIFLTAKSPPIFLPYRFNIEPYSIPYFFLIRWIFWYSVYHRKSGSAPPHLEQACRPSRLARTMWSLVVALQQLRLV